MWECKGEEKKKYLSGLHKADAHTDEYFILECLLNEEKISSICRRFQVKYSIVARIRDDNGAKLASRREKDLQYHRTRNTMVTM